MRKKRRLFALVLAAVALAGAWVGGEHLAAHAIVDAPNARKPAPAPVEGELRVETGSPRASIAFEVAGPPDARATVLLLHGIRDSRESMRGWAEVLAGAGMRAVPVDLRGHGRSTGDVLSYGVLDARDLSGVLDDLEARGLRVGKVGVLGISYGAATAIEWAGHEKRVERVVAIAPFASLAEVVPGYAPVPVPELFARQAIALAGELGGFDPAEASPLRAITTTRAPVLLFHGTADERIPARQSEELRAAGGDHAELVLVEGATHETIGDDPSGKLRARAVGWLEELER